MSDVVKTSPDKRWIPSELRAAVDSILNPFDHTTREQEKLVLDAAYHLADLIEAREASPAIYDVHAPQQKGSTDGGNSHASRG